MRQFQTAGFEQEQSQTMSFQLLPSLVLWSSVLYPSQMIEHGGPENQRKKLLNGNQDRQDNKKEVYYAPMFRLYVTCTARCVNIILKPLDRTQLTCQVEQKNKLFSGLALVLWFSLFYFFINFTVIARSVTVLPVKFPPSHLQEMRS
jgi:hypothetical protein